MRDNWRGIWLVLSTSVRTSPRLALLSLTETMSKLLTAAAPLFIGIFAAGAIERDSRRMLIAGLALVGSTALNNVLQTIGTNARVALMEQVGFSFDVKIVELTARIPTLEHLERADYLDRLQILRDRDGILGSTLNVLINTANSLVYAVSILLVAVSADWRLLILVALGVPRLLVTRWSMRWGTVAEERSAAPSRLSAHLIDLTTSAGAGAETRVFGLQRELRRRVRAAATAWQAPGVRASAQNAGLAAATAILFFGSAIALLAWMTHDALAGSVSVQSLVVAFGVVGGLERVSGIVSFAVQDVARVTRYISRFLWLQDHAASVAEAHDGQLEPPDRLESGIRLEGVSFRYADAGKDSITDVTLDAPAGSVVALVGENGAGKSTLVKLLAGLYQPTRGRILIDGIDLAEYDLTAWRSRMSGAFQDYAAFEFIAREVVGIGELERLGDEARIRQALYDGAAEDVLHSLPDGLSTQLGTTWAGGVQLSGGQGQRLAISRGMMRSRPLLLILDEPTSALDAATEHNLFERYAAAAREAGGRGAMTLLVTHRFSTVAAADLVVVLDKGRVVEVGRHPDLLANGGHYAALYNLQARGYR
ncbi:MAG: ATP-binding cassette, subfamily bacterial [Kribbellaceae bacterium]|nr:ATP-binding cassette, subfamily bacterial [Kribbellaceae bacterium]